MNKNIIGFLLMAIYSLVLTGCGQWNDVVLGNINSPMSSKESTVIFSGTCADTYGSDTSCDDISITAVVGDLNSVTKNCTTRKGNKSIVARVEYFLKLTPIRGEGVVDFKCLGTVSQMVLRFSNNVTITPASSLNSQIPLSPGQQQELTVTLPNIESTPIGSKFTILESQQYLSFVGNESSCTINANESSCSVTVKANSNITTTVNQTLRVITSEFPTESVFIKIVPNTPPIPPTPTNKYIFVSQTTTAGNFGGFDQANTICNNDNARIAYPTQLGSGTFKALLNGNNATTVGTTYLNLANEVIATATTTNLVAENTGLTNPIGKTPSGTQDGQYAWTGLASTTTPLSNCANWTTNLNTSSGTAGYVSSITAAWSVASAGATTCDTANIHLYCVQQ